MKDTVLVTGSGGLIGSTASRFYLEKGLRVIGIDNNMRKDFFGEKADVNLIVEQLNNNKNYHHLNVDIRDDFGLEIAIKGSSNEFYGIIHCAAQPSHDWAASNPKLDFEVNARGTLNLLEAVRKHCPHVPITVMSTNKVYGDGPNKLSFAEYEKRYDIAASPQYYYGITENFPVQQEIHSLFGVSKLYADFVSKEYGKNFGIPVGIFRGGCLTGPGHKGVELHGFLSYIVKCAVNNLPYKIFGYKGKQVRDQIHAYDVCTALDAFIKNPKPGEVYNIGGERENARSVLEIIDILEQKGYKLNYEYVDQARVGDHQWYITNMTKYKLDYPNWTKQYNLDMIIDEMIKYELS